jgi:hypothetical protein
MSRRRENSKRILFVVEPDVLVGLGRREFSNQPDEEVGLHLRSYE